jgi:HAD superfamily hydrolase (TIGR01509 family)
LFSAIIFDCDGVLVDSEVLAYEVETLLLAEHGLSFAREDYLTRFMGISYDAFHEAMDEEAQLQLGRSLPSTLRDDLAVRLRQTMEERLTEVPGATTAIAAVTVPKAVASSSARAALERKLRQVGLWQAFSPHVYSADDVVHAKPAPDLFLHAASALRVAPSECLVIEDSIHGVIAAKHAGMRVWGFLGGGHVDGGLGARLIQAGADRVIENWSALSSCLPRLAQR